LVTLGGILDVDETVVVAGTVVALGGSGGDGSEAGTVVEVDVVVLVVELVAVVV
jgi:hypothetical protein